MHLFVLMLTAAKIKLLAMRSARLDYSGEKQTSVGTLFLALCPNTSSN